MFWTRSFSNPDSLSGGMAGCVEISCFVALSGRTGFLVFLAISSSFSLWDFLIRLLPLSLSGFLFSFLNKKDGAVMLRMRDRSMGFSFPFLFSFVKWIQFFILKF